MLGWKLSTEYYRLHPEGMINIMPIHAYIMMRNVRKNMRNEGDNRQGH